MAVDISANNSLAILSFGSSTATATVSVATGNAVLVFFSCPTASTPVTLSDNVSNTYTAATSQPFTDSGNGWSTSVFWCAQSVGNITGITVHETGGGNNGLFGYAEITGASTSSFIDVQSGKGGTTLASWQSNAITPTISTDLAIAYASVASASALTINGGFTSVRSNSTTRGGAFGKIVGSGVSSINPSWSGGSGGGTSFTVAIESGAPAFGPVQKTTATITPGNTSGTVTLTGVTAGNLLTLHQTFFTGASASNNVTCAVPTESNGTWKAATSFSGNNTGGAGAAVSAFAFCPGANSGTHTVTVGSAQGFTISAGHVTMCEWPSASFGAQTSVDSVGFSNATTAQTNTITSAGATITANELTLVAITQVSGAGVASIGITDPPTNYTSLFVQNVTNAGDIGVEHAWLLTSALGSEGATWTWTDATTLLSQSAIATLSSVPPPGWIYYRPAAHFVDETVIQF